MSQIFCDLWLCDVIVVPKYYYLITDMAHRLVSPVFPDWSPFAPGGALDPTSWRHSRVAWGRASSAAPTPLPSKWKPIKNQEAKYKPNKNWTQRVFGNRSQPDIVALTLARMFSPPAVQWLGGVNRIRKTDPV